MPNATPARAGLALTALSLLAALALAPAPASARKPASGSRATPVQALGEAYRAFQAQDHARAYELAAAIRADRLQNSDYVLYVRAQSAALVGKHAQALRDFRALARSGGSRFAEVARWREADALWSLGRHAEAQRAYRKLVAANDDRRQPEGDLGLARFRIAEADALRGDRKRAIAGFRAFLRAHPAHPLADEADRRLFALGGPGAAELSARDRLARAEQLTAAHHWHRAIAELAMIGDDHDAELLRERDYWTAMTLFKMRRRYKDAGDIFLRIYKDMGERAARALFHGARALSRADFDADAIRWYQRVVAEYPRSPWAQEAQFLSGWLEFNMGNYQAALPHLETMLRRYGRSRWADEARWFLGFSLYLLGRYEDSLEHFEILARRGDRLEGGQGRYWHARALQKLDRPDAPEGKRAPASAGASKYHDMAMAKYRELVSRYPFSWYAHLARARLAEQGIAIGPFGDDGRDPGRAPALATTVDESLADDPLIRAADELMAAGLDVEAGVELRRGEKSFIKRHKRRRPEALAMLLDRYRRAGNFNRPWMLAVVYGGRRALDAEPTGRARIWWEHAYPQAYRQYVERWRELGENPPYYLYSIMRKESGFDPHTLSYADAIGLLQMIPPTTQRVVKHLDMKYTRDLLYDPELNVKTGSWYIGRLLQKFKGQIPFGAGSFNSGPRPVMRWLDEYGHMPVDEMVEMVPYRQTRGYMKKVTETYSRYIYLYEGIVYDQPLVVDRDYLKNELTF